MKWTILLFDRSPGRPVRFQAGRIVLWSMAIALAVGIAGWGRMTYRAVSAMYHQYMICKCRADSARIHTRVAFLNRQLETNRQRLGHLSDFEKRLRLKFGLKAVPDEVRRAGVGGVPSLEEQRKTQDGPMVKRVRDLEEEMRTLLRQVVLEDSLLSESAVAIMERYRRWAQTPSICPAEGRLASRFGWRTDPMGGYDTRFHGGIDLANSTGTPIYASADGRVKYTGTQDGFGKVIRIRHGAAGFETIYGHLDSFKVKSGQTVRRGDLIGLMGNTGRSTGPHLHYEVRKFGKQLNPQLFILPDSILID